MRKAKLNTRRALIRIQYDRKKFWPTADTIGQTSTMTIDDAELISGFYDAAFEPALFPEYLRQLATSGDDVGGLLLVWENASRSPALLVTSGHMGPDAFEAYSHAYAAIDCYRPHLVSQPVGVWTPTNALFDDLFVSRDAYFNGYLIPRNVRHIAGSRLVAGLRFDAMIGIHRAPGQEPFSQNDLARFERLGRHLQRALQIYLELAERRPTQAAALGLLEQLAPPAILVDETCRILFATPSAEALLRVDPALSVDHGRLGIRSDLEKNEKLQRLIAVATDRLHGAVGGELRVPRGPNLSTLYLVIAPAGQNAPPFAHRPVPIALVLIQDPAHRAGETADRLSARFNLTRAEARVALGLLEGKRLIEIAARHELSVETIRTQLRHVFRKTGTSRQADLVRILQSGLSHPGVPRGGR